MPDPENQENADLNVVRPPPDLPDNAPDAQSRLETTDLDREAQKADIDDHRNATSERGRLVWVTIALSIASSVFAAVFLVLAGLHIPDIAWPPIIVLVPGGAVLARFLYARR